VSHPRPRRHPRRSPVLLAAAVVAAALLVAVWPPRGRAAPPRPGCRRSLCSLHGTACPRRARSASLAPRARPPRSAPVVLDAGEGFHRRRRALRRAARRRLTVRLRTSTDGAGLGAVARVSLESRVRAAPSGPSPTPCGPARHGMCRSRRRRRRQPALPSTGVRIVAIDRGRGERRRAGHGRGRRVAALVAGVSLDSRPSPPRAHRRSSDRAAWGADERLRSDSPSYSPVRMAFVQPPRRKNLYTQAEAPRWLRAIYAYHTKSLGLERHRLQLPRRPVRDHLRGRYGARTAASSAPTCTLQHRHNRVSVMGTYTAAAPPAEAVAALERLLAWKLAVSLDPAGKATLTCGAADRFKKGAPSRSPSSPATARPTTTECPGDALFNLLPTVSAAVARRMGTALTASLSASATLISPNGDGVLDSVDLAVALSAVADCGWWSATPAAASSASWSGRAPAPRSPGTRLGRLARSPDGATPPSSRQAKRRPRPPSPSTTLPPRWRRLRGSAHVQSQRAARRDRRRDVPAGRGLQRPRRHPQRRRRGGAVAPRLEGSDRAAVHGHWDGRITSGGKLVAAADGHTGSSSSAGTQAATSPPRGKVLVDRTLGFPAAAPTSSRQRGRVADTHPGWVQAHRARRSSPSG